MDPVLAGKNLNEGHSKIDQDLPLHVGNAAPAPRCRTASSRPARHLGTLRRLRFSAAIVALIKYKKNEGGFPPALPRAALMGASRRPTEGPWVRTVPGHPWGGLLGAGTCSCTAPLSCPVLSGGYLLNTPQILSCLRQGLALCCSQQPCQERFRCCDFHCGFSAPRSGPRHLGTQKSLSRSCPRSHGP